jgi:peptide/nickel transport system substrate-binding protein
MAAPNSTPGRVAAILLLLVGLALLPGCGDSPPPPPELSGPAEPAYGDAIVEGSIGDASNLIPYIASDTTSSGVTGLVYDGLVKFDKNMDIVPSLAQSWEVSEDGLTITFHLRKGVKWHDGQPFTSADCLFTYRFVTDPETPTPYAADLMEIETAEAPDPYTFQVKYKRPFSRALYAWLGDIVPKHLLEGVKVQESSLARHPIGTGPYKFLSWKAGTSIELKSNPDYFDGRPYLDRYVIKVIPDTATMFLELKGGNIDQMGLTPIQYSRQTQSAEFKARFNKYRYLASSYLYLGYNLRNKLFQDKRVRQGLSHAINREEIIDGVLMGFGRPATGGFKPGTWAHDPDIKPITFDQAKARELLAQAGWADSDGDGTLDKDGIPFAFTIVTNQGNSQRLKTAIIIQERFSQIGVRVKIRAVEWSALLKEFIDKQNFEATIMGWTLPSDPDPYAVWHSSKAGPGGLNFIGYKNEEVDELIRSARETVDREKRRAAYFRFQQIIHEEQPYNFLYVPDALPVVASRIHGIDPAPAGIGYNLIKWFVPKELQKYSYQP